jgi:TM2 domain-containing membrane protein YozV
MELTPEERERIFLEEKARLEIRQQLEAQTPPARSVVVQPRPSNGVAAVLSLFIPGAGQMYKGSVGTGILWLVFTVIGYLMFVVPGVILHLICIFHAASMEPSGVERR